MRVNRGDIGMCALCGTEILRHSKAHIYCTTCSAERDKQRKAKWQKNNPEPSHKSVARQNTRTSKALEYGIQVNERMKSNGNWSASDEVNLLWMVRVSVPFSYALSKNHIYSMTSKGHIAMRGDSRTARDELTILLRSAIIRGGHTPVTGKVWIDLLVQKSDHRGDAVNVIDLVCDAAKDALGVDDRWFAIRRLDWEIVKSDPRLFVGVGQSHHEPRLVCSYCGQIKPETAFNNHRSTPSGKSKVCRSCLARREEE